MSLVRVFEYQCPASKGAKVEPEQFTDASITVVRSGVFGFRSDPGAQLLTAGSTMLANPGQQYEISHEHAGGDRCVIFRMDEGTLESLVGPPPRGAPRQYFARPVLPPTSRIEALRKLAEQCLASRGPVLELEALGLALAAEVGAQLGRAPQLESSRAPGRLARDGVHAALAAIEQGSTEELTLGDLARVAGMSPYHFLRVFKRETGLTPHRLLLRTRVFHALALLRDTRRPVTEIALDVGFGDLSNFIHAFRREVGCSPRDFRKTTPEAWAAAIRRPRGAR
ncbi:helix-turn-helix domain-containing protein [Corallococcus llansteffanensis]|nr:AraC family transcriptional regulator [Corallococcus llansteffanensis]